MLGLFPVLPFSGFTDSWLRLAVLAPILWWVSRPAISFTLTNPVGSVLIGLAIFALWIVPDLLFPGYRHGILFENAVMGKLQNSLSENARQDLLVLALRSLRAVVFVPILEELFWRGWLMRWLISSDFHEVRLGSYTAISFWLVAILFAAEHGPYWDVGLLAGIVFNLWMLRTRSLGDLILAHAVANGALCAYVIAAGKWEYWQ